ncbi:MAG: LON peptidase substrate-binding domain-containing protein, partial [Candidatus Accumulibacter sp.]|nr:LON peptidase substrate-binding domain-containing protein [Accumulibacter sp.]
MTANTSLSDEMVDLPLLPLRDVVVFPHMVVPLFVGRPKSVKALDMAMESGKGVLLVAQKTPGKEEPRVEQLHDIGCLAKVLQILKLPDGTVKVLVEGVCRARIDVVEADDGMFVARATLSRGDEGVNHEVEALRRAVIAQFDQYIKLNRKIPPEILSSVASIEDAGRLADTIAAHLPLKLEQKQEVLEMFGVRPRIERLLSQLETEIDILQVEKRIRGRVKRQMEKTQREYYLNEQVKAIQKELGEGEDGNDFDELERKAREAGMSKEGLAKVQSELKKLKLMPQMSAEATVVRNFIETLIDLPWRKKTRISRNLATAEKVLDKDHWGLEKVKERIIEYLA